MVERSLRQPVREVDESILDSTIYTFSRVVWNRLCAHAQIRG
jgi:hypothetical protein